MILKSLLINGLTVFFYLFKVTHNLLKTYHKLYVTYPQGMHRCLQTFHWPKTFIVLHYFSTARHDALTGNGDSIKLEPRDLCPGRGRQDNGGSRVTGSIHGRIASPDKEK